MAISRAKLNRLVKKAITSVGDVALKLTYTHVTPGEYDPIADTTVNTTLVVNSVPAVNVKLKEQEMDWFPTDINTQKLLIASVDLPRIPSASDYVFIDGVRWEVKRVSRVPGDSLFIIYIQEP